MKQKFISSVGLKSGEKNKYPQVDTKNNWKNVDWFLHTWGILPNDEKSIDKLDNDDKNYLILLLLNFVWRTNNAETSTKTIQKIQEFLEKKKITNYFLR